MQDDRRQVNYVNTLSQTDWDIIAAIIPEGAHVLDLGCGGGRDAVWLARRGYAVTAVDRLEDALDLARRLARLHDVSPAFLRRDLADGAVGFKILGGHHPLSPEATAAAIAATLLLRRKDRLETPESAGAS